MLFVGLQLGVIGFLFYILAIFSALTFHEFAHAYVANRLGDPTPKLMGRLTLNPLAHLDFLGTVFLFLAGFGWGKPVIINPRNFSNPKWDNLTVSLVGPMTNFFYALIAGLVLRFVPLPNIIQTLFIIIIEVNLIFMIFNLLPIPPLDGSKILRLFVSEETYLVLQQLGIPILFLLLIFSSFIPVIPYIISRATSFFFGLIVGQVPIGL